MVLFDDLISSEYQAQLKTAMAAGWSGGGSKYAGEIYDLCVRSQSTSLIDYGCGNVDIDKAIKLATKRFHGLTIQSYDPGIPGREVLPCPADALMCVDVLEHVEPDRIWNVLRHISSLFRKAALIVIATRPAEKRLPDDRNAHLIIDSAEWWHRQLVKLGVVIIPKRINADLMHVWLRQRDAEKF